MAVSHEEKPSGRDDIVAAAAQLYRRQGFAATSMRHIGDHIGLSKAGLYHHYPSKDALLNAIALSAVEALEGHLDEVMSSGLTGEARLRFFVVSRMRTIAANQDSLTVIWQERPAIGSDTFESVTRRLHQYREGVVSLLERAKTEGVLRADLDARLLMLALDGMTGWSYIWFQPDGRFAPDELGDAFWEFVWNSVRSDQA